MYVSGNCTVKYIKRFSFHENKESKNTKKQFYKKSLIEIKNKSYFTGIWRWTTDWLF